jgi:23S rRNA pseudouridine2605 synthase
MPPPSRRPSRKPTSSRKQRPARSDDNDADGATRLQKVMAAGGIGSRRHCEEMILEGRVQVDGKTVKQLGTKVDPSQEIYVDGELLKQPRGPVYWLVNKPDGVVSTNSDPAGRTRVIDLVPQHDGEHLFTVGRLDLSSEGLILVTNDGELANRLTHPRYGVEKTYLAQVAGKIPQETVEKLRNGVHLAEGMARCNSVLIRKVFPQSTLLEIVLSEGKNREIRRILAKVGHKVLTLKRTAVGDVKIRDLKPGEYRKPTREELSSLRNAKPVRRPPRRKTTVAAGSVDEATSYEAPLIDTRDRHESDMQPALPEVKFRDPPMKAAAPAKRPSSAKPEGSGNFKSPAQFKRVEKRFKKAEKFNKSGKPDGEKTGKGKPVGSKTYGGKSRGGKPDRRDDRRGGGGKPQRPPGHGTIIGGE